jgi:hypothetical protein
MDSTQNKPSTQALKLLSIGSYAIQHDYLIRPFLGIVEAAFVFLGYEPIRDEDYDRNYQLFPEQESFIKHVKCAISTGHLKAYQQKIGGRNILVISTFEFLKWTIENVHEDCLSPFLQSIWIELSAKEEFKKRKLRNNRSYRPAHEIKYKDIVLEAARAIRSQDKDIPVYLMIEHIQKKYVQFEKKEWSADTLKSWIVKAGIGSGVIKKLTQAEEKVFRRKTFDLNCH